MAKFLVVDDEQNTVSALRQLLEDDGHEVEGVTSGGAACSRLAAQPPFDAVLTDLEMPEVSGHEVARTARHHLPHACIFVSTSRAGLVTLEEACHVFAKPLDYDHLTKTVASCRAEGGPGGRCYMKLRLPPR